MKPTRDQVSTNRGYIKRNKNPQSDRSPEFFGYVNINGTVAKVTGYSTISEVSGESYISLSLWPRETSREFDLETPTRNRPREELANAHPRQGALPNRLGEDSHLPTRAARTAGHEALALARRMIGTYDANEG